MAVVDDMVAKSHIITAEPSSGRFSGLKVFVTNTGMKVFVMNTGMKVFVTNTGMKVFVKVL